MVVQGTPTIERAAPARRHLPHHQQNLQPQAAINWSDSAHRTQLVTSSYPAEVDNSTLAGQALRHLDLLSRTPARSW